MINESNFTILLIAVVAMAFLTALSRLLPFLLNEKSVIMRFFMQENSPIAPLGGAIIVAMTIVLALPFLKNSDNFNSLSAFIVGVLLTIIATVKGINTGFAVLIGMMGYLMVRLLHTFL